MRLFLGLENKSGSCWRMRGPPLRPSPAPLPAAGPPAPRLAAVHEQESPASCTCLVPRTTVAMHTVTFPKETRVMSRPRGSPSSPVRPRTASPLCTVTLPGAPLCHLSAPPLTPDTCPVLGVCWWQRWWGSQALLTPASEQICTAPQVSEHESQLWSPHPSPPAGPGDLAAHALLHVRTLISCGVTSVWV